MRIERPDPITVDARSILGSKRATVFPTSERLGDVLELEKPARQFGLTGIRGPVRAGAEEVPFRVTFGLTGPTPLEVLLPIDFPDQEIVFLVRGSGSGCHKCAHGG